MVKKIPLIAASLAVLLIPLFVIPLSPNPAEVSKLTILALLTFLAIITSTAIILKPGSNIQVRIRLPRLIPPFTVFVLIQIAAALTNPNAFESLAVPILPLGLSLLLFVALSVSPAPPTPTSLPIKALIASTSILSLVQILALPPFKLPTFSLPPDFTPAGNQLNLSTLLLLSITLLVITLTKSLLPHKKISFSRSNIFLALLFFLHMGAAVVSLSKIRSNPLTSPPLSSSWSVAVESLRHNPWLGSGPANFPETYTRYKSTPPSPQIRFVSSQNSFLHLATTSGLFGLGSYVYLLITIVRHFHRTRHHLLAPILAAILIHILNPIGTLPAFFLFLFPCLVSLTNPNPEDSTFNPGRGRPTAIFALVTILLLVLGLYVTAVLIVGEYYFARAVNSAAKGRLLDSYQLASKAVGINSRIDTYRLLRANASYALAQLLSTEPNLSPNDKKTIPLLLQQAVAEAKIATLINPGSATNWLTLAQVYQKVAPLSPEAYAWSTIAHSRAIAVDPTNAAIFASLGMLHFQQQGFPSAIAAFRQALALDPSQIKSHYYLALAYKETGSFDQAIAEMERSLALTPEASPDKENIKNQIKQIQTLKQTKTGNPSPAPSPTIPPDSPALPLPDSLGPDINP